jgi:hypothetical protein
LFLQVQNKPAAFDDKGLENTRIVVLREPAEVRVAKKVIEQIRADGSAYDVA